MKIIKYERCNYCSFFKYLTTEIKGEIITIFKCYNPKAIRKNGNYRIINRKLAYSGKFPPWCPLEDFYFQPKYLKE